MSLKVWLPLNGDLKQIGISNINMINSNATVDTSGKTGSCYYFNAAAYLYENTYNWTNFNTSQFSLCCWYKQPSPVASGNSQIICIGTSSGWNNIRIGLLRRTSNGYPMFSVSDGSNAIQYDCTATKFSFDTWNHIACTYDAGTVKIYLNGVLDKIYTTAITPVLNSSQHLGIGAASNGAEKLTGYLNDVRIYDHCLSAAEVREIAQGLILHYKFNKSNPNLLQSVPKSYTPTAYCGYQLNFTENLVAGQTYTLQLWNIDVAHSAKSAAALGLDFYWGGGSVNLKQLHGASYFNDGHADYICVTITPTAANASGSGATNAWFNVYNSVGNADGTRNMHIGAWKLEKGAVGTPWIDARQESIIEDSSGYQHNGIIAGAVAGSAESKRYNTSTYVPNGQADYITTQDNIGYFTNNITMNIWFKSTNKSPGSDYHHCFNSLTSWTYIEMAVHKNGYLRCGLYINGTRYVANTDNTNILDGNWHMLTMTYDGANVKRYVDGILKGTQAATGNLNTASDKFVFGRGASTGYCCKEAYLSDARLYVTALSADDILDLYHTSAKIDSAQRLHTFEFNEFSPKIQLTAAGEIKCTELNESTSTKFYKTQAISSNYLIEH